MFALIYWVKESTNSRQRLLQEKWLFGHATERAVPDVLVSLISCVAAQISLRDKTRNAVLRCVLLLDPHVDA